MSQTQEFKVTPSQSITGVVLSVEDFVGSYGPSYKVHLDTGAGHFSVLDQKTRFDKQFQEKGVSRDSIVGRTIKIWKRPMPDDPKKGYLNVDLMDTGRAANPVAASAQTPQPVRAQQPDQLPGWLNPEAKDAQIKEQARSDFDWAWNVAWGIMAPKVEGSQSAMGDPMVIQAVQSAAIGLVIRLEHERK